MSTLYLPAPVKKSSSSTSSFGAPAPPAPPSSSSSSSPATAAAAAAAPSYASRTSQARQVASGKLDSKARFVPRSLDAFGDGGSYPEIHVAQYPRGMGNPSTKNKGGGPMSSALANVTVGTDGSADYTALVTGGTNTGKKVYASHSDLRVKSASEVDLSHPTDEESDLSASRTALALQKVLDVKIAKSKAASSALVAAATASTTTSDAQYVTYNPDPNAPGYNPSASSRVIKIISAQLDPMEPPKHKHKKVPGGPAADPVPVLHSPPKKLTMEDQANWKIPSCISNWKNAKGYTIALDKRLAADGRGLQEHTINNSFATLSESLYIAERQAREEVRLRGAVAQRLASDDKERREETLRDLAAKARSARNSNFVQDAAAGTTATAATTTTTQHKQQQHDHHNAQPAGSDNDNDNDSGSTPPGRDDDDDDDDGNGDGDDTPPARRGKGPESSSSSSSSADYSGGEDAVAARQRDLLRASRAKERSQSLRTSSGPPGGGGGGGGGPGGGKRGRDEGRDVGERIALGVHTGGGGFAGGAVDARLYNMSEGLDRGFGPDDEYNAYSKPLFDRGGGGGGGGGIYRPTRGVGAAAVDADEEYKKLSGDGFDKRFKADKAFAGTDSTSGGKERRDGPVQFEKS